MKRYNIFYQIHKALRAILYDTASQLQQTDFSNEKEGNAAAGQVELVMVLFDKHADTEDGFILPAIEKYEPSVSTLFAEEHVEDHALSARMRDLLSGYQAAVDEEQRSLLGQGITIAFTEFLVFNLEHMAKEESVLNELLWRYYSDGELMQLTQRIVAHVPPQMMAVYSRWMFRGLSNHEIVGWLSAIKGEAPAPVFEALIGAAEAELPEARWLTVREQVA